jgi:hypothetical protein
MTAVTERNQRLSRLGAWMGIAFTVLFVVGLIAFPFPSNDKSAAQWARQWTDSGHRTTAIVATYLVVLGLLAFLWFAWSLRDRIRADGDGLMLTFGSVFVAVSLVAALVQAAIPGAKVFGDSVAASCSSREGCRPVPSSLWRHIWLAEPDSYPGG